MSNIQDRSNPTNQFTKRVNISMKRQLKINNAYAFIPTSSSKCSQVFDMCLLCLTSVQHMPDNYKYWTCIQFLFRFKLVVADVNAKILKKFKAMFLDAEFEVKVAWSSFPIFQRRGQVGSVQD